MDVFDFGPQTFGQLNAADYDLHHDPGNTEAAVERIAALAAGGRVLEFAIGTGRIALPLAARGIPVTGLEASPEMVEKLREKPGGEAIEVVMGDMAAVTVPGPFDVAILVFNTLFNVLTQDGQVRCFENAAASLAPGGLFVIEAFVPEITRFHDGQCVRVNRIGADTAWLEAITHDPVAQRLDMQRMRITAEGTRLVPLALRYAWPAEIDLMARVAGMRLAHRWADWQMAPFTPTSRSHVSVYEKPA